MREMKRERERERASDSRTLKERRMRERERVRSEEVIRKAIEMKREEEGVGREGEKKRDGSWTDGGRESTISFFVSYSYA